MPQGFLQGLFEGAVQGKEMKRQSLLDQLQTQRQKEMLDLEKASLKFREKQFQFEVADKERERQFTTESITRKGLVEQGIFPTSQSTGLQALLESVMNPAGYPESYPEAIRPSAFQVQKQIETPTEVGAKAGQGFLITPPKEKGEEARKLREIEFTQKMQQKYSTQSVSDTERAIRDYLKEHPKATRIEAYEWWKKLTQRQRSESEEIIDELMGEDETSTLDTEKQEFFGQWKSLTEFQNSQYYKDAVKKGKTKQILDDAKLYYGQ